MTSAARSGSTIGSGLTTAGAMVATVGGLEATMQIGWPAPLPSASSLFAIVLVAQARGIPAGFWAAVIGLGYAAYSAGFTSGQLSGLEVWGRAGARVLSFGLVAIALVVLVGRARPLDGGTSETGDLGPVGRSAAPRAHDGGADERAAAPVAGAIELEALRRVASRSAHDLNNMLAVILASCELAEAVKDATGAKLQVPAIVSAVEECALITDRLLAACQKSSSNV
jgi:hypothetical protein